MIWYFHPRSGPKVPLALFSLYSESENSDIEDNVENEEGSDGETEVEKEDVLWTLFNFIRNYQSKHVNDLAKPFLSLPSKEELPDYYEKIG